MCSTFHPSLLQQLYCRLPLLYMSVCHITYHNDGMKTQTIFHKLFFVLAIISLPMLGPGLRSMSPAQSSSSLSQ